MSKTITLREAIDITIAELEGLSENYQGEAYSREEGPTRDYFQAKADAYREAAKKFENRLKWFDGSE